ncbi:MAG: hypothetical protein WA948_13740, partial [Pontixanthobacter sp.]
TGVYTAGGDCGSIANAGLRIYDGTGLNGSATKNCRTLVTAGSGGSYDIANDCMDTYTKRRTTQNLRLTTTAPDRFTLSMGESGTFKHCPANTLDPAMRRYAPDANADEGAASAADTAPTVPARFRGLFAPDRKACEEDYNYGPAFQNVTIETQRVGFFETGGPVTDIEVDGDRAAITVLEKVGPGEAKRAIYLNLRPDGIVRYRPSASEPVRDFVRCRN